MRTYEKIYQLLLDKTDYTSGEELAHQCDISRTAVWKAIQQLEKQGLTIQASHKLGYRLVAGDLLLAPWLEHQLGFPVQLKEDSASTQQDAKRGIEAGQSAPRLYLAPSQSAAQGRFGRPFYAEPGGGIYMSLHLAPHSPFAAIKPYTILVAAAIVKAIQQLTGKLVQIKWVNDLYYQDKKIAGILTEAISSVEMQTVTDVIIGVGINLSISHFPPELADKAGSLFTETPTITRNQLIAAIWQAFFTTPEQELLALYKERSLVLGKQVTVQQGESLFSGLAQAITDTGELIVRLDDGSTKCLTSGEVRLTAW